MIDSLVKKIITHRCALDFDHGFVKAAIKEDKEQRRKWLLFIFIVIIIIIIIFDIAASSLSDLKKQWAFSPDYPDTQQADT